MRIARTIAKVLFHRASLIYAPRGEVHVVVRSMVVVFGSHSFDTRVKVLRIDMVLWIREDRGKKGGSG